LEEIVEDHHLEVSLVEVLLVVSESFHIQACLEVVREPFLEEDPFQV
jgi:hypothetical protein